ncbi:MAG: hypothetical protein J4F46_10495, partial [Dehalococcoidia bacterium]|nr:hypothetical protein [Dehalococcoidia bacterium]
MMNIRQASIIGAGVTALVVVLIALVSLSTGYLADVFTDSSNPVQARVDLTGGQVTDFVLQDEGVNVIASPATMDFRGAEVKATGDGSFATVTITGRTVPSGTEVL